MGFNSGARVRRSGGLRVARWTLSIKVKGRFQFRHKGSAFVKQKLRPRLFQFIGYKFAIIDFIPTRNRIISELAVRYDWHDKAIAFACVTKFREAVDALHGLP